MSRVRGSRGFTLIELLVVIAIIGILVAIALQSYNTYRKMAYDARAMFDLGNARTAEEAYFAANDVYKGPIDQSGPSYVGVPGFVISDTVTIHVEASGDTYSVRSQSSHGSGIAYFFDSTTGEITKQ